MNVEDNCNLKLLYMVGSEKRIPSIIKCSLPNRQLRNCGRQIVETVTGSFIRIVIGINIAIKTVNIAKVNGIIRHKPPQHRVHIALLHVAQAQVGIKLMAGIADIIFRRFDAFAEWSVMLSTVSVAGPVIGR